MKIRVNKTLQEYAHKRSSTLLLLPVETPSHEREVVSRTLILLQTRNEARLIREREDTRSQMFSISIVKLQVEEKGVLGMM